MKTIRERILRVIDQAEHRHICSNGAVINRAGGRRRFHEFNAEFARLRDEGVIVWHYPAFKWRRAAAPVLPAESLTV